jgi:hypothetical protein
VETARRKIAETDAALVVARADTLAAEGQIWEGGQGHLPAGLGRTGKARPSVLEPYAGASAYSHHGQRVVMG